jgi:hypothetical protein
MSAKVPAVVKLAKEALAENKCVVVGLQSTGEARTEEAITKYVSLYFQRNILFVSSSYCSAFLTDLILRIIDCFQYEPGC